MSWKLEYRNVLRLPLAALLTVAVTVAGLGPLPASAAAPAGAEDDDPCAFPTTPASSLEETAWRIFVAATCPATNGPMPLTFENWTEQNCFKDPTAKCSGGASRQPHASLLALNSASSAGLSTSDCSDTTNAKNAPSSLVPFIPKNLAPDAKFCEEVFANPAEVAYINEPAPGHSLRTLTQQAAYVASGNKIQFPTTAIEMKVDWLPADALSTVPSPINCNDPTLPVYTEVINDVCYALVGIHISSKLFPNWLWATFEPQFKVTNPNRCNPKLYNSCSDPWGSDPAKSTGAKTKQTAQLFGLMKSAQLASAFYNYRLVGVQNDFVNSKTTVLGSSFVEFNAQVPAQQASCTTCHFNAQFTPSESPPVESGDAVPFQNGVPATGNPIPVTPGWVTQDFSWLLGILPPK